MLIKKSHSGAKFYKSPEYCLVVDFKYLNLNLLDIKFRYPEIKHVLHKISRHSNCVYSVLDLKHAFHSINLTEDREQYTSCCASPGLPTYQNNKLIKGLNDSPTYFISLMNDLLHELPPDIREYINWIMDDIIIFTHMKVLKALCLCWKNMACSWQSTKFTLSYQKWNLWDCCFQAKTIYPPMLGFHVKTISILPIPLTVRGIISIICCVIYSAQFLSKYVGSMPECCMQVLKLRAWT